MEFSFFQEEKLPPLLQRPTPKLKMTLFSHIKPLQLDLSDETLFKEQGYYKRKAIHKFRHNIHQSNLRKMEIKEAAEQQQQALLEQTAIIFPSVSAAAAFICQSDSTADNSVDEYSKNTPDYRSVEDSIPEKQESEFKEEQINVFPKLRNFDVSLN